MAIHVGTYAKGGGEGLYPLHSHGDEWRLGEGYALAPNASFAAYSPRFDLHYLVDERSEGMIRVLRRDASGWQPLARVPTRGAEPCYLSLSPDQGWLAAANYGSGSIALFRLDPESGLPGDPVVQANSGHGPVADRQDGPHAHCAIFGPDGKWLYQTDLGTDQVLAFAFDAEHGVQGEASIAYAAPPGSGPRHLVFHPGEPLAVLVSELASTLTLFDVEDGVLLARQTVSTLPPRADGDSLGGHVAFNAAGDRLYVTNRGHDSVAAFVVDEYGLTLLGHIPAGGASPRHFVLIEDQRRMLVANEESNSVTAFDLAPDGMPLQSGEVAIPAPVFLYAPPSD